MKTVFIYEVGIRPWDQIQHTEDCEYSTISLLNQDFGSVWKTWRMLASLLIHEWPTIIKWYTTSAPQYSKTHEYLTLKDFSKNSEPKDIFKKNEETLIYSGIKHLNSNPENIDPINLKVYRVSTTLMLKEKDNQIEQLWHRLSHLKHISSTEDFKLILADNETLSFRFYDSETFGAAQLICHSMHAPKIIDALASLKLDEIPRDGVYKYIHS
ncbi:hypothetical protein [Pseudomonas poae]|uniref:Uncharacterized protein n=1 Tax=Pseudomonas poae TaxID=200451 RepID=A0A2S9DSC2_9PSED|nr:hypothetical protein [Pseudomonas poae]PRA20354.1 hypothetical protein CQZ97_29050 [Pseudomonas poae]PRC05479.1 hypothetical protein CQZ99_29090 [Pseudomonas poae]